MVLQRPTGSSLENDAILSVMLMRLFKFCLDAKKKKLKKLQIRTSKLI